MSSLLIIAPLYRSPELIAPLLGALIEVAEEIAALDARVLLINDSPDDAPLRVAIEEHFPALAQAVDAALLVNPENLGFLRSANRGFEAALAKGADALLLNSDAIVTPGALSEMAAVARLDPLTAVVSPRSNNATLCNSPYPERFRTLPFKEAWAAHRALQPLLPRVTYVPTAVGFCLYVRRLMLEEFGLFDPVYGGGYNEENDLIMRCNRRGYRAVLANHAYVHHLGSVSFSQSAVAPSEREAVNRAILLERYPEYVQAVTRYFDGVEFRTQTLAAGMLPGPSGRLQIVFDGRHLGMFHNGTFELAKKMIAAFVRRRRETFDIYIACSEAALAFHGFDQIEGLNFCAGEERQMAPFAAAVRLAQPFELEHLIDLGELAPVCSFLMLDTIAMDCQNLDQQGLEFIWRQMMSTTALVGFISEFTADQFRRRIGSEPGVHEYVALCSTDMANYAPAEAERERAAPPHILIVGNHYPHKHVSDTLDRLRDAPDRPPIVVLGELMAEEAGVTSYLAGELDQALVDSLYRDAALVLFPSHYEGFGFPVMHALANGKPLIARDLPVMREIRARTPLGANIHLFDSTEAMVDAALQGRAWTAPALSAEPVQTWETAADALADGLTRALEGFSYDACRRRVLHLETCRSWLRARGELAAAVQAPSSFPTGFPAGKRLPPPPMRSDDPLHSAGEFASVKVRSTLDWLGRAPPLRAAGRAFWRSRPRGRTLELSLGQPVAHLAKGGYGRITATATGSEATQPVLAAAILDWADLLVHGGVLELVTTFRKADRDPTSPFEPGGLRARLISSGLYPERVEAEEERLTAIGIKTWSWTAMLPGPAEDEAFLQAAFLEALEREPDGFGAEHGRRQLAAGAARRDLLRHYYAADERTLFILQRYPVTAA